MARNLGLLTGASLMGAVFASGAGVATASPHMVAAGMHRTFGVAGALLAAALFVAWRAEKARQQQT